MKIKLSAMVCASIIAISACSSAQGDVGSRDDIIVKNRGDVVAPTLDAMAQNEVPATTAPLLTPEETMETDTVASEAIVDSAPVTPAIPASRASVDTTIQAVNGDAIMPVTTPSVASGDIVVEVPEAVVQTPAGEEASISNVVSENQAVDEFAPVDPVVTENQEIDSAEEAVEEIIEEIAPARVSPYVPTN